jgi:hypothetical protein
VLTLLRQGRGVGGDARFASPAAHCAASRLEPIHDSRLVRTPAFQAGAARWLIAFVEYCMAVPANRWGVTPNLRLSLARCWRQ